MGCRAQGRQGPAGLERMPMAVIKAMQGCILARAPVQITFAANAFHV